MGLAPLVLAESLGYGTTVNTRPGPFGLRGGEYLTPWKV
jgi:hypothetical protein